ncbi:hypothetical protein ABW21_db0209422 [Orbilia brochopaga]|nr:hypothetical protein ABW21_db0209422 [Drechslerella brochopaga]
MPKKATNVKGQGEGFKRVVQPLHDIPIDPAVRIRELERLLADPSTNPNQLQNIRAALEDRRRGISFYGYQGGKPLNGIHEYNPSSPEALWFEEEATLLPFGATTYPPTPADQIRNEFNMEIRLLAEVLGYQPPPWETVSCRVLNDSGSSMLTLTASDRAILNIPNEYVALYPVTGARTANGLIQVQRVAVECRLFDAAWNRPIGDWFPEDACYLDAQPGLPRLSGWGVRRHFYIATAPTRFNFRAYVALTKGSLVRALPKFRAVFR